MAGVQPNPNIVGTVKATDLSNMLSMYLSGLGVWGCEEGVNPNPTIVGLVNQRCQYFYARISGS